MFYAPTGSGAICCTDGVKFGVEESIPIGAAVGWDPKNCSSYEI